VNTDHSYLDTLAEQAHPEGGWGYAPGQAPQLEPTCLGLLALSLHSERYTDTIARARNLLEQAARPDGSYRLLKAREEAIWPTALVLFVKSVLGEPATALQQTAGYLLGVRPKVPDVSGDEFHDINLKLAGWPWAEKNFSWVEPTCWAVLALRAVGHGQHPRVQEGMRMLLDRVHEGGGVNYGNRRVLAKLTDPIPGPTALMLLALQGESDPRIEASVAYLLQQLESDDLEHLCWSRLALDHYRHLPGVPEALNRLEATITAAHATRRQIAWLKPNCLRQALTGLALTVGQRNIFNCRLQIADSKLSDQSAICNLQSAMTKVPLTQRLGSWFRGLAIKAVGQLRPLPQNSAVHIARAENYDVDLTAILQSQYQHFRPLVPLQGKRVVLKPNLVEYHRDKVINTNPKVVAAVIDLCRREGASEVIVAEGPGHWRNVEFLVRESGLGEVLEARQVPFVDLNHDEPIKTPNQGFLTGLEYLYLTRTIATADVIISLPKLKTHHWAGATLSLKNLFGTLPGICYGWPKNELHWRGIDNSIVDIALTRVPDLAIVDGIVGMEGDGPLNGTAKPMGVLVMGHDLVATDATCCRLMELDPERIGYLMLGQMKRLGRLKAAEITQLGETIEALAKPFEPAPNMQHVRLRQSA
jgi:uncharacterized protein (DUF362 family)